MPEGGKGDGGKAGARGRRAEEFGFCECAMISFLSYLLSTKAKETSAGLATSEHFVLLAVLPFPLAVPAHVRCLQAPQWQGHNKEEKGASQPP